ncbi:TolB family protein [Bacteroidota bacterium]
MKNLFFLAIILFAACTNQSTQESPFTELVGEYLGQVQPKDSALLFAPGIVSTGMADRDIAIYPDGSEIYFCKNIGNFKFSTLFYVKLVNGIWTKPQIVEFATDPNYIFIEPHISPDGKKLYFASNKPIEGIEPGIMNIWIADRIDDAWGEPYSIGAPINTQSDQYFPSLTKSGTLYFTSEDSLTNRESIYRSKLVDGVYQEPEKLPENVNMARARFNAFISPNEDYIIVPAFGMPDTYGATDYYIVFRDENDNWSEPLNMGDKVNSANGQEWSAALSPDGKFLFYMSAKSPDNIDLATPLTAEKFEELNNTPQNGNSDIYWIGTDFINELKKQAKF